MRVCTGHRLTEVGSGKMEKKKKRESPERSRGFFLGRRRTDLEKQRSNGLRRIFHRTTLDQHLEAFFGLYVELFLGRSHLGRRLVCFCLLIPVGPSAKKENKKKSEASDC
jgi:hypothetical protein